MASTPPLFPLHIFTQIAKDICDVLFVTGILNSSPNQITGTRGFLQKTAMLIFLSATTWAYYQPIWNTRYHAQKNGECRCTKTQLWKCDGVCPGCPFYAAGKKVSIDTPIGGEGDELTLGDTLADDAPSAESILMDKELLDALYDELNRLDPDGRRICELIMQGKTEREIAADMGKRQSTINYQKNKVFSILREALKDFI